MDYKKIITRNPEVMLGKPIIKGTRITVELIMRKLASGYSSCMIIFDENVEEYWIRLFTNKGYAVFSIRDSLPGISDKEVIDELSC